MSEKVQLLLNAKNKRHKDFIRILNNPIFNNENVILYQELKQLKGNK